MSIVNIFRHYLKTSSSFQKCHLHIKSKKEKAAKKQRKGILKQSESEEAPKRQEATGSNSNQVSSVIIQDQVNLFMIYFTNLI